MKYSTLSFTTVMITAGMATLFNNVGIASLAVAFAIFTLGDALAGKMDDLHD